MPGISARGLAAPLYELRDLVGPGFHGADLTALDDTRSSLWGVAAALGRSWDQAAGDWSGTAATAAADFTAGTAAEASSLADRAQVLSLAARDAGSAVAEAGARLQAIIDRFEARVAALAPHLDEPGVAQQLEAEAERAISEASAVVDDLRAELDRRAGALTAPASGVAGFSAGTGGFTPASGFSGGAPSAAGGAPSATPASWSGATDFAAASGSDRPEAAVGLRDPGMFGDGVAVRLPDGTPATAPNAVAASAVRHALTQLGVPYRWGGTSPGVGLDCSGLTQWAYHEAGLDIPRLAQEQDIGKAVSAGSVRPGDLAVWDGHVAMIVGDSTMIEAGDPVKLSPIRTTNAGQGFQGFWRPTV